MKEKINFIENLKTLGIFLAVLWHSAIAYSTIYTPWLIEDPEQSIWLAPIKMTARSFFWGLLFLVAGYTVPAFYKAFGYRKYIKELTINYGVPVIITILTITPFVLYLDYINHNPSHHLSFWGYYYHYFLSLKGFSVGNTWLLINIMILGALYTTLTDATADAARDMDIRQLNNKHIIIYALGLFFATECVSLAYPANDWIWFHILEPYHLPQYLSLFFIGIFSQKGGWLNTLGKNTGYLWLGIGLLLFTINCIVSFYQLIVPQWVRPLWFAFSCTSFCVGLFVIFREHCQKTNWFFTRLAENSKYIYLIHVLFVVSIQYFLLPYDWNPMLKFLFALVTSYVLSVAAAELLRLIPKTKRFA
jgi:surface polysaccharide O-acyltransferase-like enzyme